MNLQLVYCKELSKSKNEPNWKYCNKSWKLEVKAYESWSSLYAKQETIKTLTDDLSYHKREVHLLKSEKETLQSVLTMKTADVKDSL